MAEALVWYLIRDHNSFMVKRGQTKRDGSIQMSKEPGNLLNVHNFKYSGIANNHTIGLQEVSVPNDKRKKVPAIQVVTKSGKDLNKPSKVFTASLVKNSASLDSTISGYRSDLSAVAAIKYSKLYRGVLAKKGLIKPSVKKNSRLVRKAKRVA